MARPVTLFTAQWADLTFDTVCEKAKSFGYDGVEIACWGDHFEIDKAMESDAYIRSRCDILEKHGLGVWAVSTHLVGQCVTDPLDERHKSILPKRLWGDGKEDGVRERCAEEIKNTARAAKKLGIQTVVGFTGSPAWKWAYSFPPNPTDYYEKALKSVADMWLPILDVYQQEGVRYALEVHPTEIAFDTISAGALLTALDDHPAFGFNFDPSHFGYQGVDYVDFIYEFGGEAGKGPGRIFHTHMKDVYWSPHPKKSGVFGGHLTFGDPRRYWDFRSVGRGAIKFEEIIRALNDINYTGPLSVEWEDGKMEREHGARESCAYLKRMDFAPTWVDFEAVFAAEH